MPEQDGEITIIGVGLIGGSIAAAVHRRQPGRRVVGCGRNADRLQQAQSAGLVDSVSTDIPAAVANSSLVIACTPVSRIVPDLLAAAAAAPAGAVLTDVGSVKACICEGLSELDSDAATFIGSHPLAGSEKTGFEHADSELFEGRVCVVTPEPETAAGPLQGLTEFWQSLGLEVVQLPAERHDRVLAESSHLPHAVAAALANVLHPDHHRFAATGFRDTTRIAAGDPQLWVDILLENRTAVLSSLREFGDQLRQIEQVVQAEDADGLKKLLQQAKTNRDQLN